MTDYFRSIPVFFNRSMVAADNDSFSPSAGKPELVVADWMRHQLDISVRDFAPVTPTELKAAHDSQYVDGVLGLQIENGFRNKSAAVRDTLPWTTGSMLAAALHVLSENPSMVACSPTSGFHHANYSHGGGFCTFNGLMVTALLLKKAGLVKSVGILDLDYHWADGTADIIRRTKSSKWINHWSIGQSDPIWGGFDPMSGFDPITGICYPAEDDTEVARRRANMESRTIIDAIRDAIHSMRGCDLVLYQAGADLHIDDPLGGLLTTKQMIQRDRIVFRLCRNYGVPLVWNLAGGYQTDSTGGIEPVLAIHRNTMEACIDFYLKGAER